MFRRYRGLAGLFLVTLLAGCAGVKYSPVVTEQKSIPDVSVIVSYQADGIYQVQVVSDLPGMISLLWNSSAYVNTGGDAVRLIHIPDVDNFPDARSGGASTVYHCSRSEIKNVFCWRKLDRLCAARCDTQTQG